jgi:hypothetical protein
MTLPGTCDSIPPALQANEPRGFLPPRISSVANNQAAIVGSVIDSISHRRLAGASVSLFRLDESRSETRFGREIPTDVTGGFAFDSLLPGRYVLKARRIGYNPRERQVNAIAGRIDTANLRLRFFVCHGY